MRYDTGNDGNDERRHGGAEGNDDRHRLHHHEKDQDWKDPPPASEKGRKSMSLIRQPFQLFLPTQPLLDRCCHFKHQLIKRTSGSVFSVNRILKLCLASGSNDLFVVSGFQKITCRGSIYPLLMISHCSMPDRL